MMLDFADRINGKEEAFYTPDYELNLYKMILKVCEKEV